MPLRFGAVIFDLDGTLINSLDDLADCANSVLEEKGFAPHPADAYRFFVGEGMETLIRRAAPAGTDAQTLGQLVGRMRACYGRGWAQKTRPYEGVEAMLHALAALPLPLAVLSNKPDDLTKATVRHFFPDVAFAGVLGSPPGGRAKPDPALALSLAAAFGRKPEQVLFVGDSRTDMITATAAGMFPAGALWGFRPAEELSAHGARTLLETPEQVAGLARGAREAWLFRKYSRPTAQEKGKL